MTTPRRTTIQALAPEIVAVLAEDVRVLNDRASDTNPGGGDVDCAVRDVHPHWPLRLRDWQLCQALWYDGTATYYVFVRGSEILAIDVLDDPRGIGRYRFATSALTGAGDSGSLAGATERAAYLTLKRTVKDLDDAPRWNETRALAELDLEAYRARLVEAVGEELASDLVAAVTSDGPPTSETLARWRRRLRRSRARAPLETLTLARMSAVRILHRVLHPTGVVVAIVGPDGSGKSTVADALPETCGQLFRRSRRIHFVPGVLPRPGALLRREAGDSSQPHARAPHGRAVSTVVLGYHWLDVLIGHLLVVAPTRARSGLVVVERGLLDIAVDPARYRLNVPQGLARAFARLSPGPDLTVVLEGPPDVIRARKPELPAAEITRQSDAWRSLTRGPHSIRVDVSRPEAEVLLEIHQHIAALLEERTAATVYGGWAAIPSKANPRLYVPRKSRAAALGGLRLEAPSKTTSRLGLRIARAATAGGALRGFRATAPPAEVRRLLAPYIPAGGTIAVKRAVHQGRYLAAILDRTGTPIALAKLATDDLGRSRLRAEKTAIERRVPLLALPLRGPHVLAADEHLLLFDWIPHERRRHPWFLDPDIAHGLGAFFAAGSTDEHDDLCGPAHGDMAPWNVLRIEREWVLVDWEVSLDDAPPFFDVFHYVVQAHSLLGRPRRQELLQGVTGVGWVGEAVTAYADGAGLPLSLAVPSFQRYLEHTSSIPTMRDMGRTGIELRQELKAEVSA